MSVFIEEKKVFICATTELGVADHQCSVAGLYSVSCSASHFHPHVPVTANGLFQYQYRTNPLHQFSMNRVKNQNHDII